MPTYDVTFKVAYDRTVRIEAPDEDSACELAADALRFSTDDNAAKLDISLYSCEVARKDDDA